MSVKQAAQLDEYIALTRDRFLRYVTFGTQSDRNNPATPSTPGQWELAKHLQTEIERLGVPCELTDHCYLIARLPPVAVAAPAETIGFLAHLDTAEEVSGEGVRPVLVSDADGRAIIRTDGSTLLGADDKAGIAALVGAIEYFLRHPEVPHGPLEFIFTPDEETGKGLPCLPRERLHCSFCYTVDGGGLGELEWECFNAWAAVVRCTGKSMHLGSARGCMANATLMAAAFACMLPRSESPEATDGRYGYYCPMEIRGDVEQATLEVLIRDFDHAQGEARVRALDTFARAVEAQFPGGKVQVAAQVQYRNMREAIEKKPEALARLRGAFARLGIIPNEQPIRGGTDGARLCELGIPTPNIFTGGYNAHSRDEYLVVEEMAQACAVVVETARA
jgi:tripeptide aminopeptidase